MLRVQVVVVMEEGSVGIGTEGELRLVAHDRIRRAVADARESVISEEASTPDATEILSRYAITPIEFDPARVTITEIRPAGTSQYRLMAATVVMPMTGDVDLLRHRALRSRDDLAHALVFADRVEVDITAAEITQLAVDEVVASVAEHVEWLNADLSTYNDPMRQGVHEALAAARAQHDKLRQAVARPDAAGAEANRRARLRAWWQKLDLGTKIAFVSLVVALVCGAFTPLAFFNDVFSFRDVWHQVFSGQSDGRTASPAVSGIAATTSGAACATPALPTLAVYATPTPNTLVFEGEGFPTGTAVKVDLHKSADPSSAVIATAGTARSDGCGKFTLLWTAPATLKTTEPLTALAAVPGITAEQRLCCTASAQVNIAVLLSTPLRIESVQPGPGDSQGSPSVTVTIAGSRPPPAGRTYWLCAVSGGKFYPKQSVSATDTVTTSLGRQPATWQITIVEAGAQGSAALQGALDRDGFIDSLPADAHIVSNEVQYQVSEP